METKEWRDEVDRTGWGDGPWDGEPDRKQWQDPETGLPCLIVRQDRWGMWCGYVGVSPGHPYYEKSYGDCDADVHGGLTYSDHCFSRICHETANEDRVWWLGFDCHHGYDFAPGFGLNLPPEMRCIWPGARYRDQAYVEHQCKSLAAQLAAVPMETGSQSG
jgi:hypothetical protein